MENTKSNLNTGIFVGVIIGLVTGVCGMYFYSSSLNKGNTFADGLVYAKKRLAETYPMLSIPDEQEVKNLSGVISEVSNGVISMKINQIEPLADASLDIRNIKIDVNTKIIVASVKNSEIFQKEIVEYQKQVQKISNDGKGEIPDVPDQFNRVEGTKEDIIKDSQVIVTSDINIRNQKSFIAKEIVVLKI